MKNKVMAWALSLSMVISAVAPINAYANVTEDLTGEEADDSLIVDESTDDDVLSDVLIDETVNVNPEEDEYRVIIDDIEGDSELLEEMGILDDVSPVPAVSASGDQLDTDFVMAKDYKLSSEQLHEKSLLTYTLDGMEDTREGVDYVKSQIFAFAESEDEANAFAKAYNAELISYREGVAVMTLSEDVSVYSAVCASADLNNNLPAVYPDYYRYADAVESNDLAMTSIDEQTNAVSEEAEGYIVVNSDKLPEGVTIDESASKDGSLPISNSRVRDRYTYDPTVKEYQWFHSVVGSGYAWRSGYMGQGIKVAIVDSGIQPNSDLNIAGSFNYSSSDGTVDIKGHGTHVAGIVGALANGTAGAGVAPEATLYNIRVLNDAGSGSDSAILAGLNKAYELNVDLVNMSLGGLAATSAYDTIMNKLYEAGTAVFVSSGNDGGNIKCYPAACNHVITVGATDKNNLRAVFSNYGSWLDISAPGTGIYATYIDSSNPGGSSNKYASLQGTSMSCPVATGEAAVILSAASGLSALQDTNGALLTGSARVDALKKLMQRSCISAGANTGKGIVYLPKALSLKSLSDKPNAPVITMQYDSSTNRLGYHVSSDPYTYLLLTYDGSTPTYKNGKEGNYAIKVLGNVASGTYNYDVNNPKKVTIKALAIGQAGLCSAVTTKTYTVNTSVKSISVVGPSKIALGKKGTYTAYSYPAIATDKAVSWSVASAASGAAGATTGVSISSKGVVTVTKDATQGKYTVTATSKATGVSASYAFDVIPAVIIKSAKMIKSSVTFDTDYNDTYNVGELLEAVKLDGTKAAISDFYWVSSKIQIATVADGVITPKGIGTVTISAIANDGSGVKASVKVAVKCRVSTINLEGTGAIARGKSSKIVANTAPSDASKATIIWSVDSAAQATGIKVKNGTISVPKSAALGEYTVSATVSYSNGKTVSASKKFQVIDTLTNSISLSNKSVTIFSNINAFGSPTYATVGVKVVGGDITKDAYRVTSDNPSIIASLNTSASADWDMQVTIKSDHATACKCKVTVAALDGSNKKAVINVNYANPTSAIDVGPAKSGGGAYATIGAKTKFKAVFGQDYGSVSNKKVVWSVTDANGNEVTDARISNSGVLTIPSSVQPGRILLVKATAVDGSMAYGTYSVTATSKVKELVLVTNKGLRSGSITKAGNYGVIYALAPNASFDISASELKPKFGGFVVTSSNPNVANATAAGYMQYNDRYCAMAYMLVAYGKGNAKITVTTRDGAKSASFSVRVLSN